MTNALTCLAPETIAAYLDRRLDPAERTRVEEHLADCGECRTLLSETAAFLDAEVAVEPAPVARVSRRPWIWSAAAAAAAVLALTPFVLRQMRPTPESALRELDRALGGKRYIEARLSGFEYGRLVSPTRGSSPATDDVPLSARAAVGRVEAFAGVPGNMAVVGAARLAVGQHEIDAGTAPGNAILLRCELVDFWQLAAAAGLRCERQYLLYPNPWPKPDQFMRRWHAHPVLPSLLALGGAIELRTNWRVYAEEFAEALRLAGREACVEEFVADDPLTPFERKYADSGHALWRCVADEPSGVGVQSV